MKITPDSNVLVRSIVGDDPVQSPAAQKSLRNAELVGLTLPALCEMAWVLRSIYKSSTGEIGEAIQRLVNSSNVVANRAAVDAGLQVLESGGDFADGVIAHEGRWLGCETFLSFDKRAVKILSATGRKTAVPA